MTKYQALAIEVNRRTCWRRRTEFLWARG